MSTPKTTKHKFTSPEGMKDITDSYFYQMQGFFEKAQEIALYYGFTPIQTPLIEDQDLFKKGIGEGTNVIDNELFTLHSVEKVNYALRPEFTSQVMRAYIEHELYKSKEPQMLYSYGPVFRYDKNKEHRFQQFHQFNLEIIGTEKPVADAIIIQTTNNILKESGAKNLFIDINCIGDKEAQQEFSKELKSFYRKHINHLPNQDRQLLKTNPLRILDSKDKNTIEINTEAPDPISFLSNDSKKHFKKILEYLEELDIPYRINKNLVRGLNYYEETVFEIFAETFTEEGDSYTHAITGGGRYNTLSKKIGHKKDIPAVGVAIGVERIIESDWWKELTPRIIKKPKIYFIQLGFEAKLKSLSIIELLRKAKMPILQSLSEDSLTTQLEQAKEQGVKYTLIFGQREALDGTVMVRDMTSRHQETVKIEDLVAYLRSLK